MSVGILLAIYKFILLGTYVTIPLYRSRSVLLKKKRRARYSEMQSFDVLKMTMLSGLYALPPRYDVQWRDAYYNVSICCHTEFNNENKISILA